MEKLLNSIATQKAVLIWNPYNENIGLTRSDFLRLAKISGYRNVIFEGAWITAYHPTITVYGYETLPIYLDEAKEKGLNILAAFLENEIDYYSNYEKQLVK